MLLYWHVEEKLACNNLVTLISHTRGTMAMGTIRYGLVLERASLLCLWESCSVGLGDSCSARPWVDIYSKEVNSA